MWRGKYTEEMDELFGRYEEMFYGMNPDGYDDIECEQMSYDEFMGYIKECLEKHVEMPDLFGGEDLDW